MAEPNAQADHTTRNGAPPIWAMHKLRELDLPRDQAEGIVEVMMVLVKSGAATREEFAKLATRDELVKILDERLKDYPKTHEIDRMLDDKLDDKLKDYPKTHEIDRMLDDKLDERLKDYPKTHEIDRMLDDKLDDKLKGFVTKQDLKRDLALVQKDIDGLREDVRKLPTHEQIGQIMNQLTWRMITWVSGLVVGLFGVFLGAIYVLFGG